MKLTRLSGRWPAVMVAIVLVVTIGGVATAAASREGKTSVQTSARAKTWKTITLASQGAWATNPGTGGPILTMTGVSSMNVSFIVPPGVGDRRIRMRILYTEESSGACAWVTDSQGLSGTPNGTAANGGWLIPGTNGNFNGTIQVPAGASDVHQATFQWPFAQDPGSFIQFGLRRFGNDAADTCFDLGVVGLQLRY